MASAEMAFLYLFIHRRYLLANFHTLIATSVEFTTLRRIYGGRDIPFQNDTIHLHVRIGHGNSGEKRLCVGVQGVVENTLLRAVFDHTTKIHNAYLVGNMLYNRQIVRNEYVGKPQLLLQITKHVNNLRLNGYVER